MSEPAVISLADHRPHLQGEAICLHCRHEWQAVVPVGVVDDLECSSCGSMRGIMKRTCAPEDGTTIRVCDGCRSEYFMYAETMRGWLLLCINCGFYLDPNEE